MDNRERLDRAFRLLQEGLRLGCEEAWEQHYGHGWLHAVNQKRRDPVRNPTTADPHFLMTAMIATWFDVFNGDHGRAALSLVYEVVEARNRWAHNDTLPDDDALRALDSTERLLHSFDSESQRSEVQVMRYDMMRDVVGTAPEAPQDAARGAAAQDHSMRGRVFRLEVVNEARAVQRRSPQATDATGEAETAAVRSTQDVTEKDVEQEIKRRLGKQLDLGDFVSVQMFADQPADVPDDDEGVRLVVLAPTATHTVDEGRSQAISLASRILGECGDGPRTGKNLLVFVAASADHLSELQAMTRSYLASSGADHGAAASADGESPDACSRSNTKLQRIDELVALTFDVVLVPLEAADEGQTPQWQVTRLGGEGRLGSRVSEHLIAHGNLMTSYEGKRIRADIDEQELWSGDGDISVSDLWSHYVRHIHMPRLASLAVLNDAISDGVANDNWSHETYGYQEAPGATGWVSVKTGQPVTPTRDGLLIHPDSVATS